MLRRLLRVPWTARRSIQSNLKEIIEYSLEGLMLKLQLQYFGHLMRRVESLERALILGKTEGKKRKEQQRIRWFGWHHRLNGHESEQAPGGSEEQGGLACCSLWSQRVRHNLATEQQQQELGLELGKIIFTIFYWPKLSPKSAQILGMRKYNSISSSFFFFSNIYTFIYLAVLGLSCCMRTLSYGM